MPRFSFSKEGMNHGINLSKHKTMYQKAQKFHTANKAWFCSIIAFFVNLSDKSQNLQDNLTVSESRFYGPKKKIIQGKNFHTGRLLAMMK